MTNGTFYLNNSGSRWINLTNGQKDKLTFLTESGKTVVRTAIFYESFGNFGSVCISYKGKKIMVLSDTILKD
jgi:arabinogalactan endo-1,4-beta-galactosidase